MDHSIETQLAVLNATIVANQTETKAQLNGIEKLLSAKLQHVEQVQDRDRQVNSENTKAIVEQVNELEDRVSDIERLRAEGKGKDIVIYGSMAVAGGAFIAWLFEHWQNVIHFLLK